MPSKLVVSLYLPSLASFFILVFWLDIAAHWYHMYATVIRDSAHGSHKVIAGGDAGEGGLLSRVLRIYYHSKIAFVGCILANELLWILLVLRLGSPSLQLSSPASSLVSSLPIIPTAAVPPSVPPVLLLSSLLLAPSLFLASLLLALPPVLLPYSQFARQIGQVCLEAVNQVATHCK